MRISLPSFATAAVTILAQPAFSAFNAAAKTNVGVYWGQGPDQPRLSTFCTSNTDIDIINLAFINVFPDQGPGGYPGDNFGNACWAGTYTAPDGESSDLYTTCPNIPADITTCQGLGKKILLSLGGASPQNYWINNDTSAVSFANQLWGMFGPQTTAWVNADKPRPFGNVSVDGFDFDIESYLANPSASGAPANYQSNSYAAMINQFKNELFPTDTSKSYYISGAPQCVLPDAHLADAIANSWFDFLFVQYYNTAGCSARDGINYLSGADTSANISFDQWAAAPSLNPHAMLYLGLPANTNASNDASFYLSPAEVSTLTDVYMKKYPARFGGVMLWDATYAYNNVIGGSPYYNAVKSVLTSASASLVSSTTTSKASSSTLGKASSSTTSKASSSTPSKAGSSTTNKAKSSTTSKASKTSSSTTTSALATTKTSTATVTMSTTTKTKTVTKTSTGLSSGRSSSSSGRSSSSGGSSSSSSSKKASTSTKTRTMTTSSASK